MHAHVVDVILCGHLFGLRSASKISIKKKEEFCFHLIYIKLNIIKNVCVQIDSIFLG